MEAKFRKLTMDELQRPEKEAFLNSKKFPVIVLLDNIRSMHNVGSIFRSADAFNIQELILAGFTPAPPHRDIQKAALGSTETVKWSSVQNAQPYIASLKADNYRIIALEQTTNSVPPQQLNIISNQRIALIAGNEVNGVSDELLALCDDVIEIEQYGTKHSLNVSVSVGIAMREIVKSYLIS
jgi:23S rRNA (guanosine2251-2'-O)-methyltransferase